MASPAELIIRRPTVNMIEQLKGRLLLATVAVDLTQVIRVVNDNVLGVNLAWWDTSLNTTQTRQLVLDAGMADGPFPRRLKLR